MEEEKLTLAQLVDAYRVLLTYKPDQGPRFIGLPAKKWPKMFTPAETTYLQMLEAEKRRDGRS